MKNLSDLEAFRIESNKRLPAWYSGMNHILINLLLVTIALIFGLTLLDTIKFSYLLLLPIFGLVWSLVEYCIHRFVLHGATFRGTALNRQHSYIHHTYFNHQFMYASNLKDSGNILLFSSSLFFLILIDFLFSSIFFLFVGKNLASLFFISGLFYLVIYESMHSLSHLKLKFRIPILSSVLDHHRDHHQPQNMEKNNFAVVFPLLDKLFKTKAAK